MQEAGLQQLQVSAIHATQYQALSTVIVFDGAPQIAHWTFSTCKHNFTFLANIWDVYRYNLLAVILKPTCP